jgi:hypothetical protein
MDRMAICVFGFNNRLYLPFYTGKDRHFGTKHGDGFYKRRIQVYQRGREMAAMVAK